MNTQKLKDLIRSGKVSYGIGIDFSSKEEYQTAAIRECEKVVAVYLDMLKTEPELKEPSITFSGATA